jgi:hypothetical protein
MRGVQTHSAADVAVELDIHWVVYSIVREQLDYREMCVCVLGAKESQRCWQSSLCGIVCAFLVSIEHVTLIKESSFVSETWLITQNLKWGKGCVIEKLSSLSNKENRSIVISKDDCGKLSWDNKHVLVLDCLDHGLTLPADCYKLMAAPPPTFFGVLGGVKGIGYFARVLSFCMKMPGNIHPTRQLFMAVHLIGCGSVPILCSVFLSHCILEKQLTGKWLQ